MATAGPLPRRLSPASMGRSHGAIRNGLLHYSSSSRVFVSCPTLVVFFGGTSTQGQSGLGWSKTQKEFGGLIGLVFVSGNSDPFACLTLWHARTGLAGLVCYSLLSRGSRYEVACHYAACCCCLYASFAIQTLQWPQSATPRRTAACSLPRHIILIPPTTTSILNYG